MSSLQMPSNDISRTFAPLGTATGVRSIIDPIDLQEDVPVAQNPYEIDRRATRHLVFVGDVIVPVQKRERSDLRLGGEYLGQQVKTLVRTKGLLRKCQLSPMEVAFDFISDEMLGDNKTGLQIVGSVQAAKQGGNAETGLLGSRKLNAVEVFPGDEIKGVLRINQDSTHGPRGIVEVGALADVSVADIQKAKIQEWLFPYWPQLVAGLSGVAMPETISELVAQLSERRKSTKDTVLHDIVDAYLLSAEQYRNWGVSYLKMASALVRLPAHQGHVFTYSPLAEMLFAQLEVAPTDEILRNPTQGRGASNEGSNAQMADLMARMVAVQEQLANAGVAPGTGVTTVADPGDAFNEPQPDHVDKEKPEIKEPVADPNPPVPPVPPAEPVDDEDAAAAFDGALDPARCNMITTAGKQCQRAPVKDGRCEHPAHALKA